MVKVMPQQVYDPPEQLDSILSIATAVTRQGQQNNAHPAPSPHSPQLPPPHLHGALNPKIGPQLSS